MRQAQQNRRGRNRGRKPQNPMSRNYESNGPDVKIRGSASHIAEKYQSLAGDALLASDYVKAENYFQHAEHYNRIIAAAQAQIQAQQPAVAHDSQPNGAGGQTRQQPQHQPRQASVPQPVAAAEDSASGDETPANREVVANGTADAVEENAPARKPRRRRTRAASTDEKPATASGTGEDATSASDKAAV